MVYEIVIKRGIQQLARVSGIEKEPEFITVADTEKVIEVEQFLERITGLRFHINRIG